MRKLALFSALALSGITACAERIVSPAAMPEPALVPEAPPKSRPSNVNVRRQAERATEDTRKRSASPSRPAPPSASVKADRPLPPEAPPPQVLEQPPEPDASNFPYSVLMPPPPQPAEPTFPSVLPTAELPPPKPAAPILPKVPIEAAMPAPPEPAEPKFPVAALMPMPPEPAEPSLPSREEIVAESSISIPFPDLLAPLSLHPRFDWADVTGSFEIPRSPLSGASELSREESIPSLIRNSWPLPLEDAPP